MEEIQQRTQDLGETSCSPEKLKKKLKMEKRREARKQKVLAQDQGIRELRQNGQIPHLSKAMLETILKKNKWVYETAESVLQTVFKNRPVLEGGRRGVP